MIDRTSQSRFCTHYLLHMSFETPPGPHGPGGQAGIVLNTIDDPMLGTILVVGKQPADGTVRLIRLAELVEHRAIWRHP